MSINEKIPCKGYVYNQLVQTCMCFRASISNSINEIFVPLNKFKSIIIN